MRFQQLDPGLTFSQIRSWRRLFPGWWLRVWAGVMVAPLSVALFNLLGRLPWFVSTVWSVLLVVVWVWASWYWSPWLWTFRCRVKDFDVLTGRRATLHFPPGFAGAEALPDFLRLCEQEKDELRRLFGFSLRGRLHVFALPHCEDLEVIFGQKMGGTALFPANVIVVVTETMNRETVRHELGHLFSMRWNQNAPPLLAEGLSTWLQETKWGQPIDERASELAGGQRPDLKALLDPVYFFSKPHWDYCYTLAGSFTGFLIRRFGWKRYRRFFQKSRAAGFESRFEKTFGVSLADAEQRWLTEIATMRSLKERLEVDALFNRFA